jgi:CRP-like cAMP-binding protein
MRKLSSKESGQGNRLLERLPDQEFQRLAPYLESVQLPKAFPVYEAGESIRHVYFPTTAAISLLSLTNDGGIIEVGVVGHEGMAGVSAILRVDRIPYRARVQVNGEALRMDASILRKEFNRGGTLQGLLLRYVHALLSQISQSAVCNHFHNSEQRLCRWLLVMQDRVRSDVLSLTHELIAHMSGASRANVTTIARKLQQKGLIRYRWGQITIVDRHGLEAASCECYRILSREFVDLL